jgi:hypothetical protein
MRELEQQLESGGRAAYDLAACVCESGAARSSWLIPIFDFRYVVVVELERCGRRVPQPSRTDKSETGAGLRLATKVAAHLNAMGASATFWHFPAEEDDVFYVYVQVSTEATDSGDAPEARAMRYAPDTLTPYVGDD